MPQVVRGVYLRRTIDESVRKRLVRARLVPIGKANGGIRPIAIGEVVLKIAGKVLFARYASEINALFGRILSEPQTLDTVLLYCLVYSIPARTLRQGLELRQAAIVKSLMEARHATNTVPTPMVMACRRGLKKNKAMDGDGAFPKRQQQRRQQR